MKAEQKSANSAAGIKHKMMMKDNILTTLLQYLQTNGIYIMPL